MIKKTKLFTYQNVVIVASVLPVIIFGFLTYNNSKKESIQNSFAQIENINRQKNKIIQDYFEQIKFEAKNLSKTISFFEKQASHNINNIQTLQKNNLEDYYNTVKNNVLSLAKKDIFQYVYKFKNNGRAVGENYLDNAYSFKRELGIKNVLMINTNGKVLYSSDERELVNKNVSQITKPFRDVFRKIKKRRYKGDKSVYFVNFGYDKISKTYKQFAISPFKDVKGFIAIEIDQKPIQKIIKNTTSLGCTAETYLIYKYKNDTFLASKRDIKKGCIGDKKSGKYIDKGFVSSGTDVKYGSLNTLEIVGYTPIKIKNMTLGMQTTVSYTEAISPKIQNNSYLKQLVRDYNYRNILLIDPKGKIFYSVKKNKDFGTNILTGRFSFTHLGKASREVFKSKKLFITDIGFYPPSLKRFTQFVLVPITTKNKDINPIIVLELKLDDLTKKLVTDSEIYNSIETYAVGKDKRLRTNTILSPEKFNILKSFQNNITIDTEAVRYAFKKGKAHKIIKDYRGISVLSSFSVVECSNFKWAVITEIDEAEIDRMLNSLKVGIFSFVFISSVLALIVVIIITNEKKKHDEKLIHNATHDSLTQLPNRKFVLEFLSYRLANSKRLKNKGAMLFVDLDRFKFINDSYGHKAGDYVLKEVASRLKKVLRKEDLLARLGGDEFILIVNNFENLHNLDILCNKIISNVSKPIKDGNRHYKVNLSIGVSIFPDDSNDPSELLQYADTAMFKTKETGRNGYTYYSKEMTDKSIKVFRVENELKKAIENDELELYYQPQVDLKTDRVVGVEALIRWHHPRDGFVMPNDFISIAEESDLIIDIGIWVLKKACLTFKSWKKMGCEIDYIAVNMSAKQLECHDCVENLKNILNSLDFDPKWLELEITEHVLVSNMENTVANISLIRDMGIKFSIDDFGTGYSSLSYLKSLPISTLKIDREFIKDILTDKDDLAIVSAIIAMGHSLNYNIIAEGAERFLEIELLKTLDCNVVQGFYYSKPLCEEDLLAYFNEMSKKEGGGEA